MTHGKSSRTALVCLFFILFSTAHASIILDILPPTAARMFYRVVAFDANRQALLHYETLPPEPFKRSLGSFLKHYNPGKVRDRELDYILSCDEHSVLTLAADKQSPQGQPSKRRYMVMSAAAFATRNLERAKSSQCLRKNWWASSPIVEKTPMQLMDGIKGLKDKRTRLPDFELLLHDQKDKKHELYELSNGHKGSFGELVTQMTLFSYGYDYLPSIYSGNCGLDGIFLSFSREYLVLTQSKMGNTNNMASVVIQKELAEEQIAQRLALMGVYGSEEVKESQQLAYKFIEESPDKVYKLAQCVYNCGLADLVIKPFDVSKYPKTGTPLYGATQEDKVAGVQTTLATFEPDRIGQLQLALKALDIKNAFPRHQVVRAFLTALGVPEDEQRAFVEILTMDDAE